MTTRLPHGRLVVTIDGTSGLPTKPATNHGKDIRAFLKMLTCAAPCSVASFARCNQNSEIRSYFCFTKALGRIFAICVYFHPSNVRQYMLIFNNRFLPVGIDPGGTCSTLFFDQEKQSIFCSPKISRYLKDEKKIKE